MTSSSGLSMPITVQSVSVAARPHQFTDRFLFTARSNKSSGFGHSANAILMHKARWFGTLSQIRPESEILFA
jgi:hypothetical protein